MTSSSKRVSSTVAVVVLALGLVGCGDDSSNSGAVDGGPSSDGGNSDRSGGSGDANGNPGAPDGPGGGPDAPAGSPEAAYVAFADAIREGDADAFEAAVHERYWSDLTTEDEDNAANLAAHQWAVENEVMSLPAGPDEVLVGADVFGSESSATDADAYAAKLGQMLDVDGLTADDLAMVTVTDGWDTGLGNRARESNCAEDDEPIEECLGADARGGEREDVDVIIVHGQDGWEVLGTEPAH